MVQFWTKDRWLSFAARHPALIQAAVWAIPAILFAAALRALLLAYQPLAYWGSDSESYFSFAYRLLTEGVVSLPEKRRYIYPLLLLPVSVLPGPTLSWVAFLQHFMGVLTLIPFAYIVRKTFVGWKVWIIPITLIYAGMPIVLWYEHELLGEAFFFASFIWAFAAWVAWTVRLERGAEAFSIWWIFFALLSICMLTKPACRFFWPGLVLGLVYIRAWRYLRWRHWVALGVLFIATLTMGAGGQASRLLYSSAFPLTVLDSPKHADLKVEIAAMVRASRARLDFYYTEDDKPKRFLRGEYRTGDFPTWKELQCKNGEKGVYQAMKELALEAIFAHPLEFIYIGLQRTVASMNWTMFKLERFEPGYFAQELQPDYATAAEKKNYRKMAMIAFVTGVPSKEPLPFSKVQNRVSPEGRAPGSAAWINNYVAWASAWGVFVAESTANGFQRTIWQMTPTPLGWWLFAGCVLTWLVPVFRVSLGVWVFIALSYGVAVHLLGSSNPRFFATAWPPLLLALAVPLDALWRFVKSCSTRPSKPLLAAADAD